MPETHPDYEQANPFMAYNHIQICQLSPEKSVVKVDLVPESKNMDGHVHGGLLYSMADCAAGITARSNGKNYVTQSAHINFLKNVNSGTIYATAEVVKRGSHIAVFHVSITDEKNSLLADGTVDMYRINDGDTQ